MDQPRNVIKLRSMFDLMFDPIGTKYSTFGDREWRLVPNIDSTRTGKNLIGAPDRITGDLLISSADLESLEGCPSHIEGGFLGLRGLHLESLEHIATTVDELLWIDDCDRLTRLDLLDERRISFAGISMLSVQRCSSLRALGRLPSTLRRLTIDNCEALKTLGIDNTIEHLDFLEISTSYDHPLETLEDLYSSIQSIGNGGFTYGYVEAPTTKYCQRDALPAGLLTLMRMNIHGPIEFIVNGADANSSAPERNAYLMNVMNKWKNQGRRGILGAQRELLNCPDFDFSLQATL